MIEAFPLCWPDNWTRTPASDRQRSRFSTTPGAARDELLAEIRRLGGVDVIISTDMPVRKDGLPYANAREPADCGAAVYFTYKGQAMCFACDKWDRLRDNIQSIRKTIEAIRGIERWGASDMMERAFRGFAALTDGSQDDWRDVLGCNGLISLSLSAINHRYRQLCHQHHPDKGGDPLQFQRVQKAIEQAREELGGVT